jgi:hypothetical protein
MEAEMKTDVSLGPVGEGARRSSAPARARTRAIGWTAFGAVVLLAAGLVGACSASDNEATSGPGAGGGATQSGSTEVTSGTDSVGAFVGTGAGGSMGSNTTGVGGSCASSHNEGKLTPLDIYIMLDQSGSMEDDNKWTNCTTALKTFLESPEADGIGVGIQYFSIQGQPPPECAQCNDCNCIFACGCNSCTCINGACSCSGTVASCSIDDYATAAVEIAPLPGNSGALISSLDMADPLGGTPTRPALEGAIKHAYDWAVANPDRKVVVVLATDGEPSDTMCVPNTIPDVEQVAQAGVNGLPSIETYVIGVGLELVSLDAIAAAGGTMKAYIVDSGGNTTQQFIDAMNAIRKSAGLACEYLIPPPAMGEMIDFQKINVQYIPGAGGSPQNILHAKTAADCDPVSGGWYYDDNASPKKVVMCPATCSVIEDDNKGKIDILLGCATMDIPPK